MSLNEQDSTPKAAVDPLQIISHCCLAGLGLATFLGGPLALLLAEFRLPHPWPKISAIIGAALAYALLDAPLAAVILGFVLSLVLADSVTKKKPLVYCLGISTGASCLVGALLLFFFSQRQSQGVLNFWKTLVAALITQLKTHFQSGAGLEWERLEPFLLYQGPFLLTGAIFLVAWVSLGAAAHLQWIRPQAPTTASALRELGALPITLTFVLSAAFAASAAISLPAYLAGPARLSGSVLFVQGCICLSEVLHRRKTGFFARTLVYSLSVMFGFYAVVALGMVSPWYFRAIRARSRFEERTEL